MARQSGLPLPRQSREQEKAEFEHVLRVLGVDEP
jgi:hypothetical protein